MPLFLFVCSIQNRILGDLPRSKHAILWSSCSFYRRWRPCLGTRLSFNVTPKNDSKYPPDSQYWLLSPYPLPSVRTFPRAPRKRRVAQRFTGCRPHRVSCPRLHAPFPQRDLIGCSISTASLTKFNLEDRIVHVDAFPMGNQLRAISQRFLPPGHTEK